jgi:cell division protein FtsL
METTDQNQSSKSMRIGLIILGILLLLSLVFLIIFAVRSSRLTNETESLQGDKQILMDEYQRMKTERDESSKKATDFQAEIERMQLAHEEEIRSRDARISGLRARAAEVIQLRQQVDEFKLMQADYERLKEQHAGLVAEHEVLNDQFNVLSEQFAMLQDSVDVSRGLHVYNISPLTKWERWLWADRYNVSRARRVDQTFVSFEIDGTPFTRTGSRTIYLNMLDPQGIIMYPDAETFQITATGEEVPFTKKQEINFTGEYMPVNFTIDHPERLAPGTYNLRVYIDGEFLRSKEIIFE